MKVEKLKDAKCKFCGAKSDDKVGVSLYRNEQSRYIVRCDNCGARTPRFINPNTAIAYWGEGFYTIHTHSERQIYEGCISLMQGLVEDFKEWLECQGIEVAEDERFRIGKYPTEIVNRLFLWHTHHSGGTSTRAKCNELGIEDSTRTIWFDVKEDEE